MKVLDNAELDALLGVLPPHIRQPLLDEEARAGLLEIVLDLGRSPEARYKEREFILNPAEVTERDIDYVVSRVSAFSGDNRAGIERTLHRISAIRNREGQIIGLTCRVGRAVYGTITIIQDIVASGKSILLLGRPGVGKTTRLREIARVLADDVKRRVIIVDTSNEIAGDGNIPHPAIGHSRRMQVPHPSQQHAVMIEAVENHMPEVIVIDEIGTELEAQAARTIAERGVQLVGTAHGTSLDNLILNPTLADLIGGIQTVTLSDEEARRRRTQKSILERKSTPTFDVVVEICDFNRVTVHPDVAVAVDNILRGRHAAAEIRFVNEDGEIKIEKLKPLSKTSVSSPVSDEEEEGVTEVRTEFTSHPELKKNVIHVCPFGINRSKLEQAASERHLFIEITDVVGEADVLITSKNYYRRKSQKIRDAETRGIPVYVLKSNTSAHIRHILGSLSSFRENGDLAQQQQDTPLSLGMREAENAIKDVMSGNEEVMELSPQNNYTRRLQHLLAERYNLSSYSEGDGLNRRVFISARNRDSGIRNNRRL